MKTVNANELKQLLDNDVLLVNTLPEDKFESTKIEGSVNIPQNSPDFVQRVKDTAGDRAVVVYCANQQCDSSTKAAQKLDAAGFSNIYDFAAGAKGWEEAGETLAASATS